MRGAVLQELPRQFLSLVFESKLRICINKKYLSRTTTRKEKFFLEAQNRSFRWRRSLLCRGQSLLIKFIPETKKFNKKLYSLLKNNHVY